MSDNTPDFFITKTLTARKHHKCCECYKTIVVGDEYKLTRGKWDGRMESYKQCIDCSNTFDSIVDGKVEGYEDLSFGELQDWLADYSKINKHEDIDYGQISLSNNT